MKKQKNLIGLFALAGMIALGVSSCKKYDDDIDQLRQEIADTKAALESALKAGKLITAVNAVAGGWDIVFSDNSKITVKNGEAGNNGFTPVIGIDKEGYWTVVTSEGGTPARIKDASQNEVKAVASVPTPNTETGTWWIDGKDTDISYVGQKGEPGEQGKDGQSPYINKDNNHWMVYNDEKGAYDDSGVAAKITYSKVTIENGVLMIDGEATSATGIPSVAYNDLNKTVIITVYDRAGKAMNYEFLQASDVMVMITSLSAPISNPLIGVQYGVAGAKFTWKKETYKQDDLLLPGGKVIVPVIVNPAGATLEGYDVAIVNPNDESFVIPVAKVTRGYDYDKYGFVAANAAGAPAANGLWSLELDLKPENLAELNKGEVGNLAVKVTEGEGDNARVIYSGYQYTARSTQINALADLNAVVSPQIVALGDKVNLLEGLAADTLKLFRDSLAVKTDASSIAKLIEVDGRRILAADTKENIKKMEGKTVVYTVNARDYAGTALTKDIEVSFYSSIGLDDVTLADAALTLRATSDTAFADLAPMFTALGDKKDLWITNAQTFKVTVEDAEGKVVDNEAQIGTGTGKFIVNFFEKNETFLNGARQSPAVDNATTKYVGINADATKVLPGNYTATITFTDKRNASEYKTFAIIVPIVVSNPVVDVATLFEHVPAQFVEGTNTLVPVFGANQAGASTSFDLTQAYNTEVDAVNYGFEYTQPKGGPETPLTDNKTITVSSATLYKTYALDLYYYHFGNKANKVLVETVSATPKSLVKEGTLSLKKGKTFEVTIGEAGLKMGETFDFADYNKVAQALFSSTLGDEIALVKVEATGANAKIVKVEKGDDADYTITALDQTDVAVPAEVTIQLTVTDKMGAKFEKDLTLTVKR